MPPATSSPHSSHPSPPASLPAASLHADEDRVCSQVHLPSPTLSVSQPLAMHAPDHRNQPQSGHGSAPSSGPVPLLTPPSSAASASSSTWCSGSTPAVTASYIAATTTTTSRSSPLLPPPPPAPASAQTAPAPSSSAGMTAHALVPPFRPPSMINLCSPSSSVADSSMGIGGSQAGTSSAMVDQLRQMQPQALAALLATRPKASPPLMDDPCRPSERFPVLLIDLRPYSAFEAGHIVGAVNLCLPTTLLKRKTFDMPKVLANASDVDRATLACWSRVQHIVLYDACCPLPPAPQSSASLSARPAVSSARPAFAGLSLAMKCKPTSPGVPESPVPYMAAKLAPSTATVHCLYGGFESFSRAFPSLIARPKSPTPEASSPPAACDLPARQQQLEDVVMAEATPATESVLVQPAAAHYQPQLDSPLSPSRSTDPNRSLHLTLPRQLAGKSPTPTPTPAATLEHHANHHHHHTHQRHWPIGKNPIGASGRPPGTPTGPPTARRSGPPALRLNLSQVNKSAPPVFSFKTKFRQLSSVSPNGLSAHAPEWLKSLVATGGIISELQAKFLDIKLSEPPPPTNCVTSKNRYYNVFPFDHNRVRLPHRSPNLSPAEPESDYINASRIHPPYTTDEFIATQAPLPDTMGDFWSMVHGEHATVILNLAPESEIQVSKAIKYWPDRGEHLQLAGASGMHVSWPRDRDPETGAGGEEDRFEYGIKRRWLRVWRDAEPARAFTVAHISFEDWDDGDAPSVDSVMYLLRLVSGQQHPGSPLALQEGAIGLPPFHATCPGPTIVHCSAGCGRTGTYVAMHSLLQLLARALQPPVATPGSAVPAPSSSSSATPSPPTPLVPRPESIAAARELISHDPIPALVRNLRAQRMMMVQSSKQFMFIYEAMIAIIQSVKPKCVFPSRVGRAAGCRGCLTAAMSSPAVSPACEGVPGAQQRVRQGSVASSLSSSLSHASTFPNPSSNPTCENSQPDGGDGGRQRLSRPLSDSALFAAALGAVPKEWTTHAHVGLHHLLTRTPSSGMLRLSPSGAGAAGATSSAAGGAAGSCAKQSGSPGCDTPSGLCFGSARPPGSGVLVGGSGGGGGSQQPFYFSFVPSS